MTFIAKALKGLTFLVLIPLGVVTLYLWYTQESIIFPAPDTSGFSFTEPGFAQVSIKTADQETLVAYWHPPDVGESTIIVFHGNGDAAVLQGFKGAGLERAGFGVLLAEYRGYGSSTGKPGEAGLHLDAVASYEFVRSKTDGPIGLYAHSLGTGIAVRLASEREVFAMVLESPFDSILALARSSFPWLPVGALLRHPFRSDIIIKDVRAPILMMHGTTDRVIPIEHGRRLAQRAPKGTRFVEIQSAGHNDLLRFGTLETAIDFFHNPAR